MIRPGRFGAMLPLRENELKKENAARRFSSPEGLERSAAHFAFS
jgi:hypothetical protein